MFRRMKKTVLPSLLLVLPLLGACSDSNSPTEPIEEVVVAEAVLYTETFAGLLETGSATPHVFEMLEIGDAEMTIVDLAPLSTLTIGLGIGVLDSEDACIVFAQDVSVRLDESLTSADLTAGTYCVLVFDVGNIFPSETVTYSLEVVHP